MSEHRVLNLMLWVVVVRRWTAVSLWRVWKVLPSHRGSDNSQAHSQRTEAVSLWLVWEAVSHSAAAAWSPADTFRHAAVPLSVVWKDVSTAWSCHWTCANTHGNQVCFRFHLLLFFMYFCGLSKQPSSLELRGVCQLSVNLLDLWCMLLQVRCSSNRLTALKGHWLSLLLGVVSFPVCVFD